MKDQNNKYKRLLKGVWQIWKYLPFIFLSLWLLNFTIGYNLIDNSPIHHTSTNYCFAFDHPGRWSIASYGEAGFKGYQYQRLRTGAPFKILRISIEQKPFNNPTIDDLIQWSETDLLSNGSGDRTEVEEIMVDGRAAGSRIFTSGTTYSKWREVYIPRETDGLVIRLLASKNNFETSNETFEEILGSFEYKSPCP